MPDYCDNPDNEGEIFFQLINMSPFPIILKKGEAIGQGIIKQYLTTNDDAASGLRSGVVCPLMANLFSLGPSLDNYRLRYLQRWKV